MCIFLTQNMGKEGFFKHLLMGRTTFKFLFVHRNNYHLLDFVTLHITAVSKATKFREYFYTDRTAALFSVS